GAGALGAGEGRGLLRGPAARPDASAGALLGARGTVPGHLATRRADGAQLGGRAVGGNVSHGPTAAGAGLTLNVPVKIAHISLSPLPPGVPSANPEVD